jgi:hypothetical protein
MQWMGVYVYEGLLRRSHESEGKLPFIIFSHGELRHNTFRKTFL